MEIDIYHTGPIIKAKTRLKVFIKQILHPLPGLRSGVFINMIAGNIIQDSMPIPQILIGQAPKLNSQNCFHRFAELPRSPIMSVGLGKYGLNFVRDLPDVWPVRPLIKNTMVKSPGLHFFIFSAWIRRKALHYTTIEESDRCTRLIVCNLSFVVALGRCKSAEVFLILDPFTRICIKDLNANIFCLAKPNCFVQIATNGYNPRGNQVMKGLAR